MLYTCAHCGAFHPDMTVDAGSAVAVCPDCGHEQPFTSLPLYAIGGASGSGKTAVCRALAGKLPGIVCLDGDIFWDPARFSPQKPEEFYEYALRIAVNIAQSGQSVAIFNAGFGIPGNLEPCAARRYFSRIHHLGLFCSDEELEKWLRARPEANDGLIAAMKGFNGLFRAGLPGVDGLDTTGRTLEETARDVRDWIVQRR